MSAEHRRSRRELLVAGASGVISGVAGCLFAGRRQTGSTPTITPAPVRPDAEFDLVAVDHPRAVEIGDPVRYSFVVENTTGDVRRFETDVRSVSLDTVWQWSHRVARDIQPGDRATIELQEPSFQFLGHREVTIAALDHRFTIGGVARTYTVGEWAPVLARFVYPDYLEVRPFEILVDAIVLAGEGRTAQRPGRAFVSVAARHVGRVDPIPAPSPAEFSLRTPNAELTPVRDGTATTPDRDPYEAVRLDPGDAVSGWFAYEVPEVPSTASLAVRWERRYQDGARAVEWHPRG